MDKRDYKLECIEVSNPQIIGIKGKRVLFITDNFNIVFNADLNDYAQDGIPNIKLSTQKQK